MATRERAIKYELDCPNKKITVTWSILITGRSSNAVLADMVERIFKMRFGLEFPPLPPGSWKLGKCKVFFKLDAKRALGRDPNEAEREGDRDIIELRAPEPGGGGLDLDVSDAKAPLILIHPDSNTGGLSEWKTAHELGHGLGIKDPPGGKWLTDKPPTDKIKEKHIEEALNIAPKEKKKAINECCDSHLTVALGKILKFPKEEFLVSNPRDPLYRIFPPGSENPFTAAFERNIVRWQMLVQRHGLTKAYNLWTTTDRRSKEQRRETVVPGAMKKKRVRRSR